MGVANWNSSVWCCAPSRPAKCQKFDAGPPAGMQTILDGTPDYLAATGDPSILWNHSGNLFYRGRLDGTARLICIGLDPGPAECLPFARER